MSDPTLTPPKSPNRPPFKPLTVSFQAYLAAGNRCECGVGVTPDLCPIHAYNTGQHWASDATCAMNQLSWATANVKTRGGCTCAPKTPAEVAAIAAAAAPATGVATAGLMSAPARPRITRFPWILPILALLAAGLVFKQCHKEQNAWPTPSQPSQSSR